MITCQWVKSPEFLISEERARQNIALMAQKAKRSNVIFRPHFKTHQSLVVGNWFRDEGVRSITVSSLAMAWYFTQQGWTDITVAFPVNIREINEINDLSKAVSLNILVADSSAALILTSRLKNKTGVFLKIDTGYGRAGFQWSSTDMIEKTLKILTQSKFIDFKGFLTHSGHTYHAGSLAEIHLIWNETLERMQTLRSLPTTNHPVTLSVGDTPACSVIDSFSGIDEVRPGNFVFYDAMQLNLGVCNSNQIAVCMVCPVVAVYPEQEKLIIHGGAVHFSKEHLTVSGRQVFGLISTFDESGLWSGINKSLNFSAISQEHGVVTGCSDKIKKIKSGDLIGIIPVHSCLTANLMGRYRDTQGNSFDHFSKNSLFLYENKLK